MHFRYIRFAEVMSQSIHIEEEDGDDGEDEIDQAVSIVNACMGSQ